MFYQVLIETSEIVGKHGSYKQFFELDKTGLSEIEDDVVVPYLQGRVHFSLMATLCSQMR